MRALVRSLVQTFQNIRHMLGPEEGKVSPVVPREQSTENYSRHLYSRFVLINISSAQSSERLLTFGEGAE